MLNGVLSETEGSRLRLRLLHHLTNIKLLFHTARVTAAILRAIATRANTGRSPFTGSPAYHALKGQHREAACAAHLKTCLSVQFRLPSESERIKIKVRL